MVDVSMTMEQLREALRRSEVLDASTAALRWQSNTVESVSRNLRGRLASYPYVVVDELESTDDDDMWMPPSSYWARNDLGRYIQQQKYGYYRETVFDKLKDQRVNHPIPEDDLMALLDI